MRKTGFTQTLGNTHYFIPNPLPPKDPDLSLDTQAISLYGQAMLEIGKLQEMSTNLPNRDCFIKAYVIKEAVLTSYIEGIHTTLLDVFTQPLLDTKPSKDTQLVFNYTKALYTAMQMLQQSLPITSRVILEAHSVLLEQDGNSSPGLYRKQAVRVGDLIPAPPSNVPSLMADLEKFINEDQTLPPLIQAGLAHVQFETIHPFLDGNGRIGRLLIVLMLVQSSLLSEPILYPSYYFKKHQNEYYLRLDRVRTHGDFEGWITYYLTAIRDSSRDALKRAHDIKTLESNLRSAINDDKRFRKNKDIRLQALALLFNYPVTSISQLSQQLKLAYNTAHQIINDFLDLGIVSQDGEQKRNKVFQFKPYLSMLEKEYA